LVPPVAHPRLAFDIDATERSPQGFAASSEPRPRRNAPDFATEHSSNRVTANRPRLRVLRSRACDQTLQQRDAYEPTVLVPQRLMERTDQGPSDHLHSRLGAIGLVPVEKVRTSRSSMQRTK